MPVDVEDECLRTRVHYSASPQTVSEYSSLLLWMSRLRRDATDLFFNLNTISVNFLDLLFPKRCVGCGKIGKYFCDRCASSIRIIEPNEAVCPVCEKPAIDGATHPGCKTHYSLDGLTSFFRYDGVVRKAVKSIKYRYISDLAKEFIDLIPSRFFVELTKLRINEVTLLPLPLHWLRLRDRGFNQAEALGRLFARRLHLPLRTDILRRVRLTEPQVKMKTRDARMKNMDNVFVVNTDALMHRPARHRCAQALAGGRIDAIFLFDDVFTTGATMRAAANVLKRAGAKFVWGVTMAR